MQEKVLSITWTDMHYKTFGDESSKEKALILHWWWGKSDSWIDVADWLSSQWFFVIAPDLPWFGKTKLPEIFTIDSYTEIVEKFTKKLKLDISWLTLIWHSNGWAISTKLSVAWNISIKKLFLIGSAGIRRKKSTSLKRKIFWLLVFPAKILKQIPGMKKVRILFYKAIGWHDYIKTEQNPLLKKTFLNIIHTDLQEVFPNVKTDTTLIRWDNDTYTPLSDWKLIHKLIPKSELIILKKEKHWIHLQNPGLLIKTILKNI